MLKYILIWLCIGYIVALIYFIYYYKFDVNTMIDNVDAFGRKTPLGELTDEDIKKMRSNNAFQQFVVGISIIVAIILWPILILGFIRTFKRKLR